VKFESESCTYGRKYKFESTCVVTYFYLEAAAVADTAVRAARKRDVMTKDTLRKRNVRGAEVDAPLIYKKVPEGYVPAHDEVVQSKTGLKKPATMAKQRQAANTSSASATKVTIIS